MGGVGTPILGRPRPLPRDRRADHRCTLNCEEPLNEDIIRLISAKKNEPDWLLEWRLRAYRHWLTLI